jgi:glutamyl-tRNA reductase
VSALWALTASAADLDAAGRSVTSREIDAWLAAGGRGVALATCHRTELYGFGAPPDLQAVRVLSGRDAIAHLLRVACGLESVIVGEDEVLHQVRAALKVTEMKRDVDRRLHRLFETAIATGRKARSRRTESSGNLAQSAVAWLVARADVTGATVVVAGAGRMGAALAHAAAHAGAEVVIASRDVNRASRLARMYAGRGVDLRAGAEQTEDAAGVAVALGGQWAELEPMAGRTLPPFADISAPQAVPEAVRRRVNGSFLGIDDLYRQSRPLPGAYIEDARRLVDAGTADMAAWLEGKA